ncbi:MAG: hypothetical protein DLM70_05595, partial [Chloroflexi bacterium]
MGDDQLPFPCVCLIRQGFELLAHGFGHVENGENDTNVHWMPGVWSPVRRRPALARLRFSRRHVRGESSAEHGLGKRKSRLLEIQYTNDQIEGMKAVKRRLD